MQELSPNSSKDLEVCPLEKTVSVLADMSELSTAKQRWRTLSAYYGQVPINDCVIKMEIESCAALAVAWGGMLRWCESSRSGDGHKVRRLFPVLSTRVNHLIILSPITSPITRFETYGQSGSAVLPAVRGFARWPQSLIIQVHWCSDGRGALTLVNPFQIYLGNTDSHALCTKTKANGSWEEIYGKIKWFTLK